MRLTCAMLYTTLFFHSYDVTLKRGAHVEICGKRNVVGPVWILGVGLAAKTGKESRRLTALPYPAGLIITHEYR